MKYIWKKIKKNILKYFYVITFNENKRRKRYVLEIKSATALRKIDTAAVLSFEKAYFFLFEHKINEALEFFNHGLSIIKLPEYTKNVWGYCFQLLVDYLLNNKLSQYRDELGRKSNNEVRKILVSGMGWSGSGAVFDYFREFHNLKPINNELVYLSRGLSIKMLESRFKKTLFKKTLFDFFKYTLFSNSVPTSITEANSINNNIFTFNDPEGSYALACYDFLYKIIDMKLNKKYDPDNFRNISSKFIDSILSSCLNDGKNGVLLNNVITIKNINYLKYLNNYIIFCSFRDPRSNYVARCEEDIKFRTTVKKYIRTYRDIRRKYDKELSSKNLVENINYIQFEDFVTSDNYRKAAAQKAGLDFSKQQKNKYFKQQESEKNISNYKKFKKQKEIRYIEKKVPEYLWEKTI